VAKQPQGTSGLSTRAALAARGPIVLASASARRLQILDSAGWQFEVRPADIDEAVRDGEPPFECCERLAREKAAAVAATLSRGMVIGSDTIVELDGELLGKPAHRTGAALMLERLAGRTHRVATAVAFQAVASGEVRSGLAVSEVEFQALDGEQIEAYLATGEWSGKAGSYAIQGQAETFARLQSGWMDTVIGLPMALVDSLAREFLGPGQPGERTPESPTRGPVS
jgi:septum formation protein